MFWLLWLMPPFVSPTLVGRDQELAYLRSRLQDAMGGRGTMVFVTGEAGIGKSRLLRDFAAEARILGTRVLLGRAGQSGVSIPFRALIEALQTAVTPAELKHPFLDPYGRLLEKLFGTLASETVAADIPPLAFMEAISRLLTLMAGKGHLLLVLEDLDWADPETISVIEYLADKLVSSSILCAVSHRADPDNAAVALASALVARRDAEELTLAPLSPVAVEELARSALDLETVPARLAQEMTDRAGGVPFLVEEMLGAYLAESNNESSSDANMIERIFSAIPHSYREIVRRRLDGLDDLGRQVICAAAILGRTFDPRLLAPMLGLESKEISKALRRATRANLISETSRHVASPLVSDMPSHDKRCLRRCQRMSELSCRRGPPRRSKTSIRALRASGA